VNMSNSRIYKSTERLAVFHRQLSPHREFCCNEFCFKLRLPEEWLGRYRKQFLDERLFTDQSLMRPSKTSVALKNDNYDNLLKLNYCIYKSMSLVRNK